MEKFTVLSYVWITLVAVAAVLLVALLIDFIKKRRNKSSSVDVGVVTVQQELERHSRDRARDRQIVELLNKIDQYEMIKQEQIVVHRGEMDKLERKVIEQLAQLKHQHELDISNVVQREREEAKARFEIWRIEEERKIRKDTQQRSDRVINGKTIEQFAPYLKGFQWCPQDVKFIGGPIDLIVFNGMSTEQGTHSVVFVEVKSDKSTLTQSQRKVRNAIREKNVEWAEVYVDSDTGNLRCVA